ncbi:MAG: DUF262 domain-containing protein [Candidatus Zixiibacteriota bacterium]
MRQPIGAPYLISDFLEWDASGQLIIAPKFQRRDIWIPKAKSYLIDTILRGMPIPPVFIRLKTDPVQQKSVREVVDGQQRLRAVLGFIKGDFSILKMHNVEFAGMTFRDLPHDVQREFLSYKFLVYLLEDVSDSEVLSIFARMNTYTVKLNHQELRNAEFFGPFKTIIYQLAYSHNSFWTTNKILSDAQIARMADAELVSTLIVTLLDGIRVTKHKDLHEFYAKYEEEFPGQDRLAREFEIIIDTIGDLLGSVLKNTIFQRIPLFYTLFVSLYDARFGLPKSKRPLQKFDQGLISEIRTRLLLLSKYLDSGVLEERHPEFVKASKYSTADARTRKIRHDFIWDYVILARKRV